MKKDDVFWVFVCVILLTSVALALVPVRSQISYVVGGEWEVEGSLVEKYTVVVCSSAKGTLVCSNDQRERELKSTKVVGSMGEPIKHPEPFLLEGENQYNRVVVKFKVFLRDEESDKIRTIESSSRDFHEKYVAGSRCKLWVSVFNEPIINRCGAVK